MMGTLPGWKIHVSYLSDLSPAGMNPSSVNTTTTHTLHARSGAAVRIINTHGKQVVDTWAFDAPQDVTHYVSMEHTRASLQKIIPAQGDTLVCNRREPMLVIVDDSSPGVHDTLVASCDRFRYWQLGAQSYHANCTDNLHCALGTMRLRIAAATSPSNLFMNVPVEKDGSLSFQEPVSNAGDLVLLRAEMDLVLVMSACPQDMLPVNGGKVTDCHYEIV